MNNRFIPFVLALFLAVGLTAVDDEKDKKEKEKEVKLPLITESVTVEAKVPRDLPYASTSTVKSEQFELFKPKDMSEVLSFTSGTYVSTGSKNEWAVKIRGLANSRITLLYDGIPVYEPYYNSFDLKTVAADQIDSVKVVKGASSVLYGPNTLGGIVDVVTKRPEKNQFSLKMDYGSNQTYGLYANGALRGKNLLFTGSAFREASDGFDWVNMGKNEFRLNSDYKRTSLGGKLYFYPGWGGELMAEANYYQAEYGIPTSTTTFNKQTYWRFKDWRRFLTNIGGSFPLFDRGYIKARIYYVKHDNVLDAYKSNAFDTLQWESTYDNYALGAFALGMAPLGERHDLHASLSFRDDDVRTQSALGAEWQRYQHKTFSLGLEDHFRVIEKLELMAGASLDYLSKQNGVNKTTVNPILGVKFNPKEYIDLRLTLSQKSRFPSMKNLYSDTMGGGNPDLRDEKGTNIELGGTYDRDWFISGAIFRNRIHDLIDRRLNSENLQQYVNIAEALIQGAEFEVRKSFGLVSVSLNYTYLDTENIETGERLDLIPASQFNAAVRFFDPKWFSLTLWGLSASSSIAHGSKETVTVPAYTLVNIALEREIGPVSLFLKLDNLFDAEYITEPGFPMRARTFMAGFRFLLAGKQ